MCLRFVHFLGKEKSVADHGLAGANGEIHTQQ